MCLLVSRQSRGLESLGLWANENSIAGPLASLRGMYSLYGAPEFLVRSISTCLILKRAWVAMVDGVIKIKSC